MTPLHHAAANGHKEATLALLDRGGAKIEARDAVRLLRLLR
jgi:ankyrin repeat protein